MTVKFVDPELFRAWIEAFVPPEDEYMGSPLSELTDNPAAQQYIDTDDGTDRPGMVFEGPGGTVTVVYTWESELYGSTTFASTYRTFPVEYLDDFFAAQASGGAGLDCESLRECIADSVEETPLLGEEEMPRDEEDFLLWQYLPPETYNELLEEPIQIPFKRMSDIVAILQVMQWQLNEIITIQRSEVVGAAFPEWNQVRIENRRPVGIFQACELLDNGKLSGAHYTIQIPWMRDDPEIFLPQIYWIVAGGIQYLRVFEDNSRICVYVDTEAEGLRVCNQLSTLMDGTKNQVFTDRPTPIRGGNIPTKFKLLKYLSYYEGGVKKARAKWSRLVLDPAQFYYPSGWTPG